MWAEKHKRITLHTNQSEFKNENAKSGAGAAYSPVFQSFELSAGVFFLVSGLGPSYFIKEAFTAGWVLVPFPWSQL